MILKVKNTIKKYNMLESGSKVIASVSGGVDSSVMLHVLSELQEELALNIIVCHLNHNLRGLESDRDFEFVKNKAEELGLEFVGEKLTVSCPDGENTQSWARDRRYEFFERVSSSFDADIICLGHNSDDRVENFLIRLIKGAGSDGLTGMKPVRDKIIRPLIEVSRLEIEKYARDNKVDFVEDSTNKSTKYERNKVRLELVPFLENEYNQNIKSNINNTIKLIEQDNDYLNTVALSEKNKIVLAQDGDLVLDRGSLLDCEGAIVSRIILNLLFEVSGGESFYSTHVESVIDLLRSDKPNSSIDLPGGVRVVREYETVKIITREATVVSSFEDEISLNGTTLVGSTGDMFKSEVSDYDVTSDASYSDDVVLFDYREIKSPITVRNIRAGDRMTPFGMTGTKKLKDILIDNKIPRSTRASLPVVVSGSDILWAVGVKRSNLYKVSDGTKEVLKITHWKQ